MARRFKTSRERRVAQKRYRRARRQYQDYLEKFEARRENFESRGLEFYDPIPLTYRDFKTVRAEKINDLKLDIKEGKRKTIPNDCKSILRTSEPPGEMRHFNSRILGFTSRSQGQKYKFG